MTKPEPAGYRAGNWMSRDDALQRRRSLLVRLDRDMARLAPKAGRPGRPPVFSGAAIQFCLMVKVLFGPLLRQTTGMVSSILRMSGSDWPVPDFATLSRRQSETGPWPRGGRESPMNERLARKHATRRRRYRKVHLATDMAAGGIRAVESTSSREGDSPALPDLLDQIPQDEEIATVNAESPADAPSSIGLEPMAPRWETPGTAGGAQDARRCHAAILARGGTGRPGIPPELPAQAPLTVWLAPPAASRCAGAGAAEPSAERSHPWSSLSPSASIRPRARSRFAAPLRTGGPPSAAGCAGRRCPGSPGGPSRAWPEWRPVRAHTAGRGTRPGAAARCG